MKTIKLSNCSVDIIEKLTWGGKEKIQNSLYGGFKITGGISDKDKKKIEMDPRVLLESKYVTLETCIKKITSVDGKVIEYTREWLDDLSIEDGDTLYNAVEEVSSPEKK
jgi:hypothetical protein